MTDMREHLSGNIDVRGFTYLASNYRNDHSATWRKISGQTRVRIWVILTFHRTLPACVLSKYSDSIAILSLTIP